MFESQPSSTPPNNALRLMFEESRKARAYAGICEATLYDAMEYYKLESHSRQSPEFNDVVQRLLARLQQLLDEGYGGVPSQDFSLIYQEILYATSTLPDAQSGLRDSPPYSDQQQFLFQSSSTSIIPSSVMPCDVPLGTIDNSINSGTHGVNVNDSWHAPGLVYNPASLDTSYPTGDGQHASHNVHATDGQRYILSNSDRNPTSIPAMDTTTYRCHDIDATDGIDSVADPMHGHQSFTCIAGSTHSSNIPSSSVPLYTVCPAPNSQSTLEEAFYLNCPTVSRTDNCDGASSFASDHEKGLSYRIANSWEVLIAEKHLAVVNMEQEHERSVQRVDGGWLYGPSHKTYVDSDNFKHSTTADNSMALVMNWNTSQSTHVTQTSSRNLDYTMIVGLFPEYAGTRSLTSNPLRFPHSGEGKQLSKTFQGYIIYLGNNATTKQVAHGVFYRWSDDFPWAGMSSFLDSNADLENCIWKPFFYASTATAFFQECLDCGIFQLLREPCGDSTFYVVIEGVNPGIYQKKQDLIRTGLRFRGGKVIKYTGAHPRRLYETYISNGEVYRRPDTKDHLM